MKPQIRVRVRVRANLANRIMKPQTGANMARITSISIKMITET